MHRLDCREVGCRYAPLGSSGSGPKLGASGRSGQQRVRRTYRLDCQEVPQLGASGHSGQQRAQRTVKIDWCCAMDLCKEESADGLRGKAGKWAGGTKVHDGARSADSSERGGHRSACEACAMSGWRAPPRSMMAAAGGGTMWEGATEIYDGGQRVAGRRGAGGGSEGGGNVKLSKHRLRIPHLRCTVAHAVREEAVPQVGGGQVIEQEAAAGGQRGILPIICNFEAVGRRRGGEGCFHTEQPEGDEFMSRKLGFEFMCPLVAEMFQTDPSQRRNMDEAVQRWQPQQLEALHQGSSWFTTLLDPSRPSASCPSSMSTLPSWAIRADLPTVQVDISAMHHPLTMFCISFNVVLPEPSTDPPTNTPAPRSSPALHKESGGISLRLAADGLDVAVADLPSQINALNAVVAEIQQLGRKAVAVIADVSKEDEVKALVETTVSSLGRLDMMVANAGIVNGPGGVVSIMDGWDVNLRGTLLCYQYAARQMIKQGAGGRIIGASSVCGQRGTPFTAQRREWPILPTVSVQGPGTLSPLPPAIEGEVGGQGAHLGHKQPAGHCVCLAIIPFMVRTATYRAYSAIWIFPTWQKGWDVNLRETLLCYQYAARQMIKQGAGGRIIGEQYESDMGKLQAPRYVGLGGYCILKAAIRSMTQTTALELREHNVTVNSYAPGAIDTNMIANPLDKEHGTGFGIKQLLKLGDVRTGTPTDVDKQAIWPCLESCLCWDSCAIPG
ncbi:hypothetical protein B0H14DRAFT_2595107 [Mycena olivaceomarginata]|nr:hypothetical protein B0H14DRAFT_2595107 [Mycena olivaceomarginata]